MRNGHALRRWAFAAGVSLLAAIAAGCDDDDTIGPSTSRTYNQVQRLGNPLVSEVFLLKRDHPFHAAVGPDQDVADFGATVAAFPGQFGRPDEVGATLASVLLPDMLIVDTSKPTSSAGWLTWALANGWGGRTLDDDVVDAGLSAIFGTIVSATNKVCDNGQLPLCTDEVGPHGAFQGTFPYLNAPK